MPRIPLIEDLTNSPVPEGSNLLVEYDPASQWYASSITMTAEWLRGGGKATYIASAQAPKMVRLRLEAQGLKVSELENNGILDFFDYYSASMGNKSEEMYGADSLKVADLSIAFGKALKDASPFQQIHQHLRIWDNASVLARFNEERAWLEFELTRLMPRAQKFNSTRIFGLISGLHSNALYKQFEAAVDGIIDFKLEEDSKTIRNLMRIRTMRHIGYDPDWHRIKIGENFEVTLEK